MRLIKELKLYIETLKRIIDRHYLKETVFYSDQGWYSREHCRYISNEELTNWILEITEEEID
jgi:hypothetical protein